ncbi:hypothetical protein [Thiocapsa sp.]|uniref:hypothetical protein n=1 Tax=Thiocapsa sp. TaxID=2024551 RepID=UPI002C123988|nr:hypothetical protein [Thiocapsa sp.]HSO81779.1 hypothetical protein [Thiocapsa sp.]
MSNSDPKEAAPEAAREATRAPTDPSAPSAGPRTTSTKPKAASRATTAGSTTTPKTEKAKIALRPAAVADKQRASVKTTATSSGAQRSRRVWPD